MGSKPALLFIDFEVFSDNWLVVIANLNTKEHVTIVDDAGKLESFYNLHQNDIWIGYNIKRYDAYILKGIILGYNPYDISHWIIDLHLDGWRFSEDINRIPLNVYDVQFEQSKSLKYYEGSLGHSIVESGVDFKLNRKLTPEEIQETIKYCTNDVDECIRVFMLKFDDFKAQLQLINMFNLCLNNTKKTKVQLSAHILGAEYTGDRGEVERRKMDEFNIDFPTTLKLDKYSCAKEWYENHNNRDYELAFDLEVGGVLHQFGWGGLHGAINNYSGVGDYIMFDVASLYPSLMVNYNLFSRYAKSDKYVEILSTRLKYKAEKNPLEAPLKIVLNGSYGAMKDTKNPMYDPLQANRVCVYGQLLLLDLLEKIEDLGLIIQSNTDGILFKPKNEECKKQVYEICKEWQTRTKLKLDFKEYTKVFQKDVNNYVIVGADGKVKTKGAYAKKLNELNYENAILNEALVEYLVNGVSIEETINTCTDLRKFQMIKRGTGNFPELILDGKTTELKTIRIFASKKGGALYKRHKTGRIAKVENVPDSVQMINDDITGVAIPEWLDKQWYIDTVKNRVVDFITHDNSKKKRKGASI